MLAFTNNSEQVQWKNIGLTPNHYYTLIDAVTLLHKLGSEFKVLKLRNAFENENYEGEGAASDSLFWDQVENDR